MINQSICLISDKKFGIHLNIFQYFHTSIRKTNLQAELPTITNSDMYGSSIPVGFLREKRFGMTEMALR
jgi:hypothetical protein